MSKPRINYILIIIACSIFVLATAAASYAGAFYEKTAHLNKDIDGDDIADINLDLNKDYIADINIDVNDDDIPDLNIDYKGNKQAIFNLDLDQDGDADYNVVTLANTTALYATCTKNCDTDGDGWPETNIDIDGDGVSYLDRDLDKDGVVDLNIDTDGDMVCNVMCDTNNDDECDLNCIEIEVPIRESGGSLESGNPNADINTASLIIVFNDSNALSVDGLVPIDQPGIEPQMPSKTFTVKNNSTIPLSYSIQMNVITNTFDISSNNFQYRLTSNNDGGEVSWTPAPRVTSTIVSNVEIEAGITQTYTLSFRLYGNNQPQNYDQGKTFLGSVKILAITE